MVYVKQSKLHRCNRLIKYEIGAETTGLSLSRSKINKFDYGLIVANCIGSVVRLSE